MGEQEAGTQRSLLPVPPHAGSGWRGVPVERARPVWDAFPGPDSQWPVTARVPVPRGAREGEAAGSDGKGWLGSRDQLPPAHVTWSSQPLTALPSVLPASPNAFQKVASQPPTGGSIRRWSSAASDARGSYPLFQQEASAPQAAPSLPASSPHQRAPECLKRR